LVGLLYDLTSVTLSLRLMAFRNAALSSAGFLALAFM
jgi:hypothetical protein